MREWFVAHTHPCKEHIAEEHLLEQGFRVYIPRYQKVRRHARRVDTILAPLFPRYIFVEFDSSIDPWRSIDSTRGVSYLLRTADLPTPVSSSVIARLKTQEDANGLVPLASLALFAKGDHVRIVDGAFVGHTAYFESMDEKQRVYLLLTFLGRETRIRLPIHAIEAA